MSARPSFKNVPKRAAEPADGPCAATRAAAHAAFDRLDFTADRPVVVAVSAGGDSTALLHLLHGYLNETQSATELIAVTIDHGLRHASVDEAVRVGRWCAKLGVQHRTLCWSPGATLTGLQARGRMGRYELLAEVARSSGAAMVLTGHTADDQAETVAMRHARAETGIGLAGIDEASLYRRKTWFVRPLLGLGRAELRSFLAASGAAWLDDPSNKDYRFERTTVRTILANDPEQRARMLATAEETRAERRDKAVRGAACLADRDVWYAEQGRIMFEPSAGKRHDGVALMAAMSAALTHVGRLPRLADAVRAETALTFGRSAANGQSFTIAGCRLRMSVGHVAMEPDPRHARAADEGSFAQLLPLSDLPLAQAMARLVGAEDYPSLP